MLRVGSDLFGVDLTAQHGLMRAIEQLSLSQVRLSTLKRISRGADDPAGVIGVGQLTSELASLQAANRNAARAGGVVHTADSAMGQVGGLLRDIKANLVEVSGGGLSDAEISAKQIEIDAAVEALNMIGQTTAYGGQKLLDGSLDPETSGHGMTFVFSADPDDTVELALPMVSSVALGGADGTLADITTGGAADTQSGELSRAVAIVEEAEDHLLEARARAGAFEEYTIGAARSLLDTMEEHLTQGISLLADTDVASEASNYVRAQILVQSATAMLNLVGQRRSLITDLFAAM